MNKQILDAIDTNKYLIYLRSVINDIDDIRDEIIRNFDMEEIDPFINKSHQMLSPNIYIENLVFKYVFKYLHNSIKIPTFFDSEIKLDIRTIIATYMSAIQRPNIPKPWDVVGGFKDPDWEGDFRIISRFERELGESIYGEDRGKKVGVVFEGLLPHEIETNPLPQIYLSNHIWEDCYYSDEYFIQGFNSSLNSIESHYVLWINSDLLNDLELRLDDYKNGLRALNSNGEEVLKFRCWREQLINKGALFVGLNSNIARLEGCDLILREDYYGKLKRIVPGVVCYKKVI